MTDIMGMPEAVKHDPLLLGAPAKSRASAGVRHGGSVLVAALCHAGLAWLAMHAEAPPKAGPTAVTEVSLLPPSPSPPPPPPAPEVAKPEPPAVDPKPVRARAPSAPREEPKAASAAPLLTAPEEAPDPAEPVRFVTDPNGTAFGFGVVARGGTAKEGLGGNTAKSAPASPTPVVDPNAPFRGELGRAPRLTVFDPCRGFFPSAAQVDRGDAAVRVTVAIDGSVAAVSVLAESPLAQGFGKAARACLLAARFEPALDTRGRAVVAIAPITVKFSR